MLRHVIADPKDTFSVTGGSEVSNYGTVNHAAPLDTAQDRTSLSAVLHVTLRHQKADQVQITCSTIHTLVLLFLEAKTMNVSL